MNGGHPGEWIRSKSSSARVPAYFYQNKAERVHACGKFHFCLIIKYG